MATLAAALPVAGNRNWPARDFWPVSILTVLLGVGVTVFLEWLDVAVRGVWACSDLVPVPPVFGFKVGFSPPLQWAIVPPLALWRTRRHGATGGEMVA